MTEYRKKIDIIVKLKSGSAGPVINNIGKKYMI